MVECKVGPKVMLKKGGSQPDHAVAMAAKQEAPHAGSSSWLGQDGKPVNVSGNNSALVADVLARIDDLMKFNDFVFGVRGYGGNVILTDSGTNGGAYHMGCDFANGGDWYEALYSPPAAPGSPGGITFGLVQAEVVESYMGIAFNGGAKTIDCGDSFGEALSRYLAMSVTGGTNGSMGTSGFVSATSWDGSDWISRLSGTDGDYSSTGCGMVYISWMLKQGYTIDKLTQAGGPTCADNYAALTGKPKSQAWSDFMAALNAIGGMSAIKNDNPFKAPDPVYPLSPIPPVHTCPVGQHWDDAQGKCVPDVPTPPVQTLVAQVAGIPSVPFNLKLFGFLPVSGTIGPIPAQLAPVVEATAGVGLNWGKLLLLIEDGAALAAAVATGNIPAILAAAAKLAADWRANEQHLMAFKSHILFGQLFQDIFKTVLDYEANVPVQTIVADAKAIAVDLGFIIP